MKPAPPLKNLNELAHPSLNRARVPIRLIVQRYSAQQTRTAPLLSEPARDAFIPKPNRLPGPALRVTAFVVMRVRG